jgi:hypothetical protein
VFQVGDSEMRNTDLLVIALLLSVFYCYWHANIFSKRIETLIKHDEILTNIVAEQLEYEKSIKL